LRFEEALVRLFYHLRSLVAPGAPARHEKGTGFTLTGCRVFPVPPSRIGILKKYPAEWEEQFSAPQEKKCVKNR
jgi:hypothetical protein